MATASRRSRRVGQWQALRPRNADELHGVATRLLGLCLPRTAVMPGSAAPFDYLRATFFDDAPATGRDLVVWASRGGGKTVLGAAATLLDMVFKPGIQVCILGGSFEQSSRMYEQLRAMFDRPVLRELLAAEPTQRQIRLVTGSYAKVLTQSPRSVRGQHVHKLRCDEVDEFQRAIWQAAQMVPRSGECGGRMVRGTVEAISTMHRPLGVMSEVVGSGGSLNGKPGAEGLEELNVVGPRVIRWCVLDVIERCPADRPCEPCPLWADCQGRAKAAAGFLPVDDVIALWRRSSDDAWSSEMMCRRPRQDAAVFRRFDATPGGRHVLAHDDGQNRGDGMFIGGMDFGIRGHFVMLWARVHLAEKAGGAGGAAGAAAPECLVEVLDEYVHSDRTLEENLTAMKRQRSWPVAWLGVDPAGGQRNAQTGRSDIEVLRRAGFRVRDRRSLVADGIERLRRRLDHGTLRIHARCSHLIAAMRTYHFDADRPENPKPVKDGPDHVCDALRYLVVNLEGGGEVRSAGW